MFPLGGPLPGSTWIADGRLRLSAPEGPPRGLFLHLHGGGWTFGAPEQYDALNQAMARATGLAVVSARYRLAPEHPWPAGFDDAAAALDWALGTAEFGDGPVFIGGESAGAHLAACALLARPPHPRLAGALLFYGLYDLRLTPSMARFGPESLILSTPTVRWFVDNLTGRDSTLAASPAASPLLADLSAFPPSLLVCGTADPLIDDTLFMAARLAAAGRPVATRLWPGGAHGFDQFDLPIARAARADAQAWLAARLAG